MDFHARYNLLVENVEAEIAGFFKREKEPNPNKRSIEVIDEFSLRGGKRIRPIAIIVGYGACGGKDIKEITKASISLELLHNYFLMHDDIMDQDPIRRNKPTVHKIYEEMLFKKYGCSEERATKGGENFAIVDGDITSALARKAILTSKFPADAKCKVLEELVNIELNTAYGQQLDELSKFAPASVNTVLDIHRYKTAWYTLAGPLRIGAIFANANEEKIAALTDYGMTAGLAFQIKDDMMGVLSPLELHKAKNDVSEGKTTMPLACLYECGTPEQINAVKAYVGKPMTEEDTFKVIAVLNESGALKKCQDMADEYVAKAKDTLNKAKLKNKGFLKSLADFAAKRSR